MKNYIIKILSAICAVTLCFGFFTACGGQEQPGHSHDYSLLKYDTENHWYECLCGDKSNMENHKGGTATTTQKAKCEVCNQEYSDLLEEGHVHEYATLKYDAENHWYECLCGDKSNIENHKGGTATATQKAKCEVCNQEYGAIFVPEHTHAYTLLKYDENSHWKECLCGEKQSVENHKGGNATENQKAKCSVCNQEYGQILEHSHNFTETITSSTYLKEKATCTSKALFYYSCECGEKGEEFFEFGDIGKHNLVNGRCTACEETFFTTDGNYIYFGKYPQTIKDASVNILSSEPNANGYYIGSDNEEYAKVSAYPFVLETNKKVFKFSNDEDIVKGNVYYFKVEPIKWRVLKVNDSKALLVSDVAIDRNRFASSNNNYKNSEIRAYLNDDFLTKAFGELETSIVNTVTVDNSASTTAYSVNPCACEDTQDKVFLLSYKDVTNSSYGFTSKASREISTSDYIRAKGVNLYPYNNIGTYNAHWITRSPEDYSDGVSMVHADGSVTWIHVSDYGVSIVPAIQIDVGDFELNISGSNGGGENNTVYTREGDYIYMGRYPQTLKADGVTVSTTKNSNGYYTGSDGAEYYSAVGFPYDTSYKFTNGTPIQNSVIYYFKVEPIKWKILKEESGVAFLLADSIISGYKFDSRTACTYYNSLARAHVTLDLYDYAFNSEEQQIILTTKVDNSVASTGYTENPNACEDTEDKLFLLSYLEATSTAYGFSSSGVDVARQKMASDYARVVGVPISTSSDLYGYGNWWLRSMSNATTFGVRQVYSAGGFNFGNCYDVGGIVPAMRIQL
ncbi:MAG: hypothetical protein IKA85_05785 [Clostridia bacterium]|nr:hypothetical protein [Clostridia bacterium]